MPAFAYRARDRAGQVHRGTVEAADERAAAAALRAQGMVVTDLRPAPAPRSGAPAAAQAGAGPGRPGVPAAAPAPAIELNLDLSRLLPRRRLSRRELAVFCRQLAGILDAGVPLLRGFALVTEEVRDRRLRATLEGVAADVEAGRSLAEALAAREDAFPPLVHHLVAAGEQGGFLADTLRRLAEHLEKEEDLAERVRSATLYPKIVAGAAVLIVALLVTLIVPTFSSVFEGMGLELPGITRAILAVGAWLRRSWFLLPAAAALLYLAGRAWGRTPGGRRRLDRLALRLPVLGPLATKRAMAVLARTLGALLQGGVPVLLALELASQVVGNAVLAQAVEGAAATVRAGEGLAAGLRATPFIPRTFVEMVRVGEETGRLEEMLFRAAALYEADAERIAGRLATMIEPVIIVVLGGLVALILLSVFIPLFDVYQGLQQQ